jgi:hypothetical protein
MRYPGVVKYRGSFLYSKTRFITLFSSVRSSRFTISKKPQRKMKNHDQSRIIILFYLSFLLPFKSLILYILYRAENLTIDARPAIYVNFSTL